LNTLILGRQAAVRVRIEVKASAKKTPVPNLKFFEDVGLGADMGQNFLRAGASAKGRPAVSRPSGT
jgi:hypothetical protein